MNNDKFKAFLGPIVEHTIKDLGGIDKVREMHAMVSMTSFVTGYVCGTVVWTQQNLLRIRPWNDVADDRANAPTITLTQEEIRRTFDFVRLRLESESTTS
jgi:predicted protein tyrosine phosphatase